VAEFQKPEEATLFTELTLPAPRSAAVLTLLSKKVGRGLSVRRTHRGVKNWGKGTGIYLHERQPGLQVKNAQTSIFSASRKSLFTF
jgi:hypothetical protein